MATVAAAYHALARQVYGPGERDDPLSVDGLLERSAGLHRAIARLSARTRIKVPKLVVVGTQSSGKSSLLNALVGVQLLPMGESMTTRAAIQVQLVRSEGEVARVEFGAFVDDEWEVRSSLRLSDPPTEEEQALVRRSIEREEGSLTGGGNTISQHAAVSIRLHSQRVPNLFFVDLPGITMTALTSEGQPQDMCDRIRALIRSYIDDRTIVLLVCAARADLEADAAMELCRKATGGARTIGCLTKPDLCDSPDGILAYLEDRHSADLALEHGYFVVRTRFGEREPVGSVYASETQFFRGHAIFSRAKQQERLGSLALAKRLHRIVARNICASLPDVRAEVAAMLRDAREEHREKLSGAVPISHSEQVGFIHARVSRFCADLETIAAMRRPDATTGPMIRRAFEELRAKLRALRPFEDGGPLSDGDILGAIENCEGWSMIAPVPPVEIVEFFLRHAQIRPIEQVLGPSVACFERVDELLARKCDELVESHFARFARLKDWVRSEFTSVLAAQQQEANALLQSLVEVEEAYIFTDNPAFLQEWSSAVSRYNPRTQASTLRSLFSSYFQVVAETFAGQVPKLAVLSVRRALQALRATLHGALLERTHSEVADLLFESDEIEALRKDLGTRISEAEASLRVIDEIVRAEADGSGAQG